MKILRIHLKEFLVRYEDLIRKAYECIFLLFVGIYAFESFYDVSLFTFPQQLFDIIDTVGTICRYCIGFEIAASVIVSALHLCPNGHFLKWDSKMAVYTAVCCLAFAAAGIFGQHYMLCLNRLPLLMAGAHNIDFRKITAVFFAVTASFIAAAVICSCTGVITNLDYQINRLGVSLHRYAMGANYPTDFCAHVFFCLCCYAYTRGERIRKWEIVMMTVVTVLSFAVTISYTSFCCNILLICCVSYVRYRKRKKPEFFLKKGTRIFCISSFPVFAALMIGISWFYDGNSAFWSFMDSLFHNRLKLGNLAFQRYRIPLLTQYVAQNGYGGRTDYPKDYDYFYLDSSYVNMLFRLGLIVLIFTLVIFMIINMRMIKEKNAVGILILTVIAIQCIMEHHLIEYFYHPFFLAFAADLSAHDKPVFSAGKMKNTECG